MTSTFHPTSWPLVLRARGEGELPVLGKDQQALCGSEVALSRVEGPEMSGSKQFGGGDEQDVVTAVAGGLRSRCGNGFRPTERGVGIDGRFDEHAETFVSLIVRQPQLLFHVRDEAAEHQRPQGVGKLEVIQRVNVERPVGSGQGRSRAFAVRVFPVNGEKKAGVGEVRGLTSRSMRSTYFLIEILQFPGRHGDGLPVWRASEYCAFAPVHRCLRRRGRRQWFAFYHHILPPLHPSHDGGKPGLQVVKGGGFHDWSLPHRPFAVKA